MQKEVSWYFVDLLGQRKGPITQQQLLDAVTEGRVRPASLVWREGMAQWQPLSTMTHELHPSPHAVPPVPPAMPPAYVETNPFATSPSGFVADGDYADHASRVIYGGFARRLLALMLDSLILWIISIVAGAILGAVIGASSSAADVRLTIVRWVYPTIFLISLLYWSLQESSVHQATLGKRALGIKVTDLNGKQIGWGRAVGRWFGRMLSALILCIGYLLALFTSRKQTLHDMLAGTVVVDRWAYTRHPERQKEAGVGTAAAVVVVLVACVGIVGILAAIAIPQYQTYVMRSQIMNAYSSAEALRPSLVDAYRRKQRCPINGEAGLQDPEAYAAPYITAITIGPSGSDTAHCTLGVVLRSSSLAINGKHLWLSTVPASDTSRWICQSDVPERYLPPQCR